MEFNTPAEGAEYQPAIAGPGESEALCPDIYVVQPGDTYYGIAAKLGMTVYELSGMNPDVNPDMLQIGEELCIPLQTEDTLATPTYAEPRVILFPPTPAPAPPIPAPVPIPTPVKPPLPTPTPVPKSPAEPTPIQQPCPANHIRVTVPAGWDCSQVLRRYNVSYLALASANPRVSIDSLMSGQLLCIPPSGSRGLCGGDFVTYVMEVSDTLESLARRYGISSCALLKANGNLAPSDFVAGRVICVPCEG